MSKTAPTITISADQLEESLKNRSDEQSMDQVGYTGCKILVPTQILTMRSHKHFHLIVAILYCSIIQYLRQNSE